MKYRFDVAMSGRLGMEMQPKDMTEADKKNFLDGKVVSGKILLEEGIVIPFTGDYSSVVMSLTEVR